jgi:hypothetical protein
MWIHAVIGILGGVAYLAKGSVSPLIMVFIGVCSLRAVWEVLSARRRGYVLSPANQWHWRHYAMGLVALVGAHLMVIGPRLAFAHEKYGSAFHSYPAYWMWLDSFGGPPTIDDPKSCYGWMDKHNTKEELTAMLPDERPSLSNYSRTHSRENFINRLWSGTRDKVAEFFWPKQTKVPKQIDKWSGWRNILEWRGLYLAWLALMLGGLFAANLRSSPKPQHAGHMVFLHGTVAIVLFTLGAFAIYSLSYGWYSPIARGSGDRFMLSLYLPLAFSLIWAAESVVRRIQRRHGSRWITRGYLIAQWLLFAALAWRVIEVLRMPKFYNS